MAQKAGKPDKAAKNGDKVKSESNGDARESIGNRMRRSQSGVDVKEEKIKVEDDSTVSTPIEAANMPRKTSSTPRSPAVKTDTEQTVGGDITLKLEEGKPPKLSRSSSKKIPSRPPPLFLHLDDATQEAQKTFEILPACTYANKYLGTTDAAYECDCTEEWDASTSTNNACGEDSDCINRATRVECPDDCHCGDNCQNQRFMRKQYANVTVIKTEKKGYGLRTNVDLPANALIFEYIGEVIGEQVFRKRLVQYDTEGIKHFYFMSLNKGEFIDATKKGNLGRFCNHSCNPNCYVDKWVVGERLRMGIFTERKVQAGEELVFNYNVDRYGANPQPCYCGEPNCTGFIGGKTQTERATKLSAATIEALGLEDGEDWDIAVASKKSRKKKTGDADEEYVDSLQPKALDEGGVTKVMATLMQCKEKWIAVKLLSRLQRCDDERVRNRVVRMHGYQILNTALTTFLDDSNVALQVLDILHQLPRITRNKIEDSKIEPTVEKLMESEHEDVKSQAAELLKIWSKLEMGYRIPRLKRDPNAVVAPQRTDRTDREERRRQRSRSKTRSKSPDIPKGPAAPSGPRQPNARPTFLPPRPNFRRPALTGPLPTGWFTAQDNGKTYYYSINGATTWTRPTLPAATKAPPPPPKEKTNEQKLQDIINSITQESSATTPQEKTSSTGTPQQAEVEKVAKDVKVEKEKKWQSLSEEKKMKVYENTLFPHVKYVMDKYKSKLPREDLKRFAKDVSKKLVASDFKHNRVEDPTTISSKQERNVKKYVKDYFDKAVAKKVEHDKRKQNKESQGKTTDGDDTAQLPPDPRLARTEADAAPAAAQASPTDNQEDGDAPMSEDEDDDDDDAATTGGTKRKREEGAETPLTPAEEAPTPAKRSKDDPEISDAVPPPPPPPPPPPANLDEDEGEAAMDIDDDDEEGQQEELADQQAERPADAPGDGSESFTQEAREATGHEGQTEMTVR